MPAFIDANGQVQQVQLEVGMYRTAHDQGLTLPQYLNRQYPTAAGQPKAFEQLCASEGIFLKPNKDTGVRPASMHEIMNGSPQAAGTILKEGVPASRILFPSAYLTAIEDKLVPDYTQAAATFDTLVAIDDSINNDRFERPVLNFSRPEGARSMAVTQLAMPNTMLAITAHDVMRKIPVRSLGLEISEQAMKATSFDIVGLSLARQAMVERNERANQHILALLNGDPDIGDVALSTITDKVVKAKDLDASITDAGKLTQTAWIKWLARNALKRKITHVITDLDGAMAIENRQGRPVITQDNPTSPRIDTIGQVLNPSWEPEVKIFLSTDPNWPAGTIMGIDQRYGIHRVTSLTATYEAIEALVMRRSTQMRFDVGDIAYRLFDEAFEVLTLTL
jgi:hypothetical protein